MQDMSRPPRFWRAGQDPGFEFVKRVLIVIALAAFAFLLWQLRDAFLLAFAAIIVAVLLLAAASPIERRTSISHRWALAIAGVAILIALALLFWLIGAQVQSQVSELVRQLPQAWQRVEEQLGFSVPLAETFGQEQASPNQGQDSGALGRIASAAQDVAGRLVSYGYMTFEILTTFILVVIGGVFLAGSPDLYRRGLVKLFPPSQHQRIDGTLGDCGYALRQWLLAQLMAMAIVGVLVGLGTWLIGLPAPLALGLFAALTEFVPIVGPIVGAIPALLLALTDGSSTFLWTLLLYVAVQQLESNVITPLVQERMVTIPPALLLLAVVAFGLLFGALGVIVASPLAVVVYVAVKKLYVRDTLGEQTHIPGEEKPEGA